MTGLPDRWWELQRPAELDALLSHRRWWGHTRPFPHVRAVNVFRPAVFQALEAAFRDWQRVHGEGSPLPGHDLTGATVTAAFEGPLRLFASPGWHQLLTRVFNVRATEHVNLGLHHHRPASKPGFAHNDLNPAWFPVESRVAAGRPVLADPARVRYTDGLTAGDGIAATRVIRAIAVIFYLANPVWEPSHRGETGLYRSGGDDPAEPVESIPPHSNSLLAFECTPWSYHGFQGGGTVPRNSVVQWLHRPASDADGRWGADAICDYPAAAP